MCTRFLGRQLSWRGELVESEALLREWLEDSSSVPAEILTRVDLVELLVKTGDLAGAEAELSAVDDLLDRHPLSTSGRSLRDLSAALLFAAEGRHEEAAAAAERAAEGLGAASIPWDEARAYALWSRVLRAAGDESGAVEKLAAAHDVLERIDAAPVWRDWVLASAE
jgi:tetratricopeptide (TPR) repeat protein